MRRGLGQIQRGKRNVTFPTQCWGNGMVLHCAPSSLDFSTLVKYWERKQLILCLPELKSKDLICISAATRPCCTMGIRGDTWLHGSVSHFPTAPFPLEVHVSISCVETKYGHGGSVAIFVPSDSNSCLLVFPHTAPGPESSPWATQALWAMLQPALPRAHWGLRVLHGDQLPPPLRGHLPHVQGGGAQITLPLGAGVLPQLSLWLPFLHGPL